MWPLILLGGAVWLLAGQTSQLVNELQYSPTRIQFLRSGLSINIIVHYTIENPRDAAAQVQGLSGTILANGAVVGTFVNTSPINIQPRATTSSSAKIKLSTLAAGIQLYKLWRDGKTPRVDVKGTIQTTLANIPFAENYLLAKDLKLSKKV